VITNPDPKELESEEGTNSVDYAPDSTDSTWNKVHLTPRDEPFVGQMGVNIQCQKMLTVFLRLWDSIYMCTANCEYGKRTEPVPHVKIWKMKFFCNTTKVIGYSKQRNEEKF
jgi:hypothetical protein